MAVLYVVSDEAGAGKTALCVSLVHELRERGAAAYAIKLLTSARAGSSDPDARIFQHLLGQPEADWPFPGAKKTIGPALSGKIEEALNAAREGHDTLIAEGAAGLTDEVSARMAELLDARVLVVERYREGLEPADMRKWSELFGDRLLGLVINGLTRYRTHDVQSRIVPGLSSDGLRSLGAVPEERRLLGATVAQIASHLNGRFAVGEEMTNGLVEHFLVGGMGLDSGDIYFGLREHKAVIVRGDRPDIQMAALTTPTQCMVFTKGIEPIEYVSYEAELEQVPIIVVPTDTLDTMTALNTLQESASFDHPGKVERYAELLLSYVDLGYIYEALGLSV